jgi:ribokinase
MTRSSQRGAPRHPRTQPEPTRPVRRLDNDGMSERSPGPVIVVVGSLNIDLIAYVRRVPTAGETVIGERFQMGFGGKGANQAVMAARLGGRVSMVGALGDDVYARMTLENLERQRVDATHVARVGGSSGVAPIWVEPDGTNRIIVVPGANDRVDPEAAATAIRSLEGFGGDPLPVGVVIGQLEIPQAVTAAAFRAAHDRGSWTILNPAPAATLAPELLEETDYLIPNEHELGIVAGVPSLDLDDDAALLGIAESLGVRLLVTLGARGAAIEADGIVTRVQAENVKAVDTTGAGDAFVGAFGYGLAAGLDELSAVRLGILCASDSVTKPGTQSSFASLEDAAALLARVRVRAA